MGVHQHGDHSSVVLRSKQTMIAITACQGGKHQACLNGFGNCPKRFLHGIKREALYCRRFML